MLLKDLFGIVLLFMDFSGLLIFRRSWVRDGVPNKHKKFGVIEAAIAEEAITMLEEEHSREKPSTTL